MASAAARGADAADLAGQALRLTAAGDREYDGRLLALARYLIDAGEHARATRLLTERAGALSAGPVRAAAYLLLGQGADLAAQEVSNQQVAAQLYLSVNTVQARLSHVYAKLGIGSRAQLARRLGAPG